MKYSFYRGLTFMPYWLGRLVCLVVVHLQGWRIDVFGAERLPRHGPVVYAINHIAFPDSVFVGLTAKRQISYLAKSEYFDKGSLKGLLVGFLFWLIGQISTDRSGGKASDALARMTQVLRHGHAGGIHVEGTRSPDGRLYNAHTSFAYLAKETRAIVVPVSIVYPDKKMVEVHYGEPIPYSHHRDLKAYEFAELVTDRIQARSRQERAGKKASIGQRVKALVKRH